MPGNQRALEARRGLFENEQQWVLTGTHTMEVLGDTQSVAGGETSWSHLRHVVHYRIFTLPMLTAGERDSSLTVRLFFVGHVCECIMYSSKCVHSITYSFHVCGSWKAPETRRSGPGTTWRGDFRVKSCEQLLDGGKRPTKKQRTAK